MAVLARANQPLATAGLTVSIIIVSGIVVGGLADMVTGDARWQLPMIPRVFLLGVATPLSLIIWFLGRREALTFRMTAILVAVMSSLPLVVGLLHLWLEPLQLIAMNSGLMPLSMTAMIVFSGVLLHPRFTLSIGAWCILQYLILFHVSLPYMVEFTAPQSLADAVTSWGEALRRGLAIGAIAGMTALIGQLFRSVLEQLLKEERQRTVLETTSEAKGAMLATMSHELRTPMNAIIGYARRLIDAPELSRESREGLSIILDNSLQLVGLINDSLDNASIEAGRMTLRPAWIDLHEFGHGIILLFLPKAQEKGLPLDFHVTPETPVHVLVDEKRLRQVLINLIGNALKFTTHGSIRLHFDAEHSDALHITVQDTGVGIPPDQLETVFERFAQLGDEQMRAAGSGLGLSISRRILTAMGGEIGLDSTLGEGTTAWVRLPVGVRVPQGAPSPEEAAPMMRPDANAIEWLRESAMRGDMREIVRRAGALAEKQPTLSPFMTRLQQLAEEFEDTAILELLEPSHDEA
ncbi:MAG: ATP-binding protein [Myxococcota bacterium]